MNRLYTPRLALIPATLDLIEAETESPARLAAALDAVVPADWPPGEYDRAAIEYFRARLKEHPEHAGWYGWYAILNGRGANSSTLIGAAGFFGPPGEDRAVELGYSIVPEAEGHGYATEIVQALVEYALAKGNVERAIAHTTPGNAGSIRVLEKAGFRLVGPGKNPGTLEYERLSSGD